MHFPTRIKRGLIRGIVLLVPGILLIAADAPPKGYPRSYIDITAAARREKALVVYSTTDAHEISGLLNGFKKRYPFLQIDYRELQSSDIYKRVINESRLHRPTGDLVWSSAMDLQIKLVNDGYAQAYASPEKPYLPPWAIWKNEAYGITAEPVVFVYNRKLMPPGDIPKSHSDIQRLLRAKTKFYLGKVVTGSPSESGSAYLNLTQDYQANRDIWKLAGALGATNVRMYPSTGEMLTEIAAGRAIAGYNLIGPYALDLRARNPAIGVVMPTDYTLVVSRIAIIPAEATHPNAAKLFLDYLLSRNGQLALSRQYMGPVRGDVPVHAGSRPAANTVRPVRVGPTLLTNLDQIKRRRFLQSWSEALAGR